MASEMEKNSNVIASDRVDGTAVYGSDREKIGSVDKVLIDKMGGNVTDVVLSVGGFLGIGDEKHSIPWARLDYDTDVGGYMLNVTKEQLKDAPRFAANEPDRVYDREYQQGVYDYWDANPTM